MKAESRGAIKTMRFLSYMVFACALATAGAASSLAADKPENSPNLKFVTEYIRELAAIENIRASWDSEQKQAKDSTEKMTTAIHGGTRMQLELRSQIQVLETMRLSPPFDALIPLITGLYKHKVKLYQQLVDACSTALDASLVGPKPDVDYGKLVTDMPKIRAELDYIDQSLFEGTPAICLTLVDHKPDSHNHLSHLIITKAARVKLLSDLTDDFGAKLDQKDRNYTVSAAKIVKDFLRSDYKCSDEPWQ